MQEPSSAPPEEHPPPEPSAPAPAPLRPRRRWRWRRWAFLLAVLLAIRVAVPILLGPFIEERLSRVLGAAVDVGDVAFAPIDAVLTLRDVTVQAPAGVGTEDDGAAPALTAARVRLDLQWLPLLHRALLVRELAIESGRIDVARLAGDRGGAAFADRILADPVAELPPGWEYALDRIVLRDTQVLLAGVGGRETAPLVVGLRDAEVSTLARRTSAFGRAPNLHVDALVEGGRVRVDGTSDLRDEGAVVDALVRVKDLPLARLEPWLARYGWSRVAGRVSGLLRYRRDPGRRDLFTGRLRARRLALHVPDLEGPALAVRRVEAEIDGIDLLRGRVGLGALSLHGARLAVRLDLAAPLPVLDGVELGRPPRGRQRGARAVAAEQSAPWGWSIESLTTAFARLHVAGNEGETLLAASLSGENLGPDAYWSPLRAWISRREGVAIFDGTARFTRGLLIEGRVTAEEVDLPAVMRTLGVPHADLVQAGRGFADLVVEIEPGATKHRPLDVRGRIGLTDLWAAGPASGELALGAAAVDLKLAGVEIAPEPAPDVAPVTVRFSDAVLSSPYVLLTRTGWGWVLPPSYAAPAPEPGAAPIDARAHADADRAGAGAEPATADVAPPEVVGPPEQRRADVVIGDVRAGSGRLVIVDRSLTPARTFDVALSDASAQNLRFPEVALDNLAAQASDPSHGTVQVGVSRGAGRWEVDVAAQSVPLATLAPYLGEAGLPYHFTSGTGSLLAHVVLADDDWTADTTLVLRDASLGGNALGLREWLGGPPEAALAALRDRSGVALLRLPLSGAGDGDAPPLADVVGSALRAAVARARQVPLPEAPIQVAFSPGRSELSVAGTRQLAQVADVLAARRDAVVELSSMPSGAERRWIAEQELLHDLEPSGGFMGVLRVLGVRDQHARIRDALEARGAGLPGRLDAEDERVVDELIAQGPPVSDDRLAALAAARVARVQSVLGEQAVAPSRVIVRPASGGETLAPPSVRVQVRLDPRIRGVAHAPGAERP